MNNKLLWYWNRLSLMSLPEIGYRLKTAVLNRIAKPPAADWPEKVSLLSGKPRWYFDQKPVRDPSPSWAETLLAHRFSFFALKDEDLGPVLDWHRDHMNKITAPVTLSSKLDYRDFALVGDIKYVWELSRHLHLVSLAKAYYLTGKEAYKREVLAQIDSWIEANPYLMGVHWTSALESGIRLISWSWVWFFLGDIPPGLKAKWVKSVYQHCFFISKHFSKFSSANNHLIGEAAGLFIASIVWDFGKGSDAWRKQGFKILTEEIERQTFLDGVNKEQAISYQQFVLDFFLLAGLLGEKNGMKFPDSYWKKIEKMMDYIAGLMDVWGNIPHIGDEDDGFVVKLADANDFSPYRSLLATGAVLFGRGDFKQKADFFDEKSLWLLGVEGKKKFSEIASASAAPRKDYPEGGYYILSANDGREDEIKAVFDCGPLGYLSLGAHGHADALSFTLSVGGTEFLIDPGTYAYHTQKTWRDYFRGTWAHNTVVVDGVDQSVIGGNFMWLRKAGAKVLKFEDLEGEAVVTGEHEGYKRLKSRVVHRREVRLDKVRRQLVVLDRFSGRGSYSVEQMFHFDSRVAVGRNGAGLFEAVRGERKITLQVDSRLQPTLLRGSLKPIGGWQSRSFDMKEPCYTIVSRGAFSGPYEAKTVICINP